MYKACVIVISDKGYTGEEEDIMGKYLVDLLRKNKFDITAYTIVPEIKDIFKRFLIKCCDEYGVELVVTVNSNSLGREVDDGISIFDEGMTIFKERLDLINKKNLDLGVRGETLIVNVDNTEEIEIDIVKEAIKSIKE
ncbi:MULTISPECIES: molybdopterin-binding protein [Clostridium]|uniref:Uncharacterized protein n=1 Tax=Clostridium cibarium TaxID=2762247 RepID=A0ABR8PXT5_9CLOT|nr:MULTISPECIES: molybdopterin-binding protein [Clostridium]MBD7912963.1 hypothetical protein [Clostridium cibarium]